MSHQHNPSPFCGGGGERIYVGGIDPSMGLTVSDVLQRLQARISSEKEMRLEDIHQGRCYLQFHASVTKTTTPTTTAASDDDAPPPDSPPVSSNSSSSRQTPLDKIKSWFNNVTWKGCKLVVQKARPHLIERLRLEREGGPQSNNEGENKVVTTDGATSKPAVVIVDLALRRHWKVKRGYSGERCKCIDTQPCEVKDWASFARIRHRHTVQQRKSLELQQQQSKAAKSTSRDATKNDPLVSGSVALWKQAQKQSYYNRSIHLRFADAKGGGSTTTPKPTPASSLHPHDSVLEIIQHGDYHHDDDDENASSSSPIDDGNRKDSQYVWSDEDESSTSESPVHNKDDVDDQDKSSIPKRSPGDTRLDDGHEKPKLGGVANSKAASSSYAWFDEDSSEDTASDAADRTKNARLSPAFEGNKDDLPGSKRTLTIDDDEFGLKLDEESNLKVLSALFPNWNEKSVGGAGKNEKNDPQNTAKLHQSNSIQTDADRSDYVWSDDDASDGPNSQTLERKASVRLMPRLDDGLDEFAAALDTYNSDSTVESKVISNAMQTDEMHDISHDVDTNLKVLGQLFPEISHQKSDTTEHSNQTSKRDNNASSGWGQFGQMLRYDPTNIQSSQKFQLDDDATTKGGTGEKGTRPTQSTKGKNDVLESTMPLFDKPTEQQEFGEPKENPDSLAIYEQGKLEQVFKTIRESSSTAISLGEDSFSFGFSVEPNQKSEFPAPGRFSFSFPSNDRTSDNAYQPKSKEIKESSEPNITRNIADKRNESGDRLQRAFQFPNEKDLDEYVRHFYHDFNDGARIINDLEQWRNDPDVKQRWLKERLSLTQDWKRKQKAAAARKQKRFRR